MGVIVLKQKIGVILSKFPLLGPDFSNLTLNISDIFKFKLSPTIRMV